MKEVSSKGKYQMEPDEGLLQESESSRLKVAVLDLGAKGSMLSCLRERGCRLTVYPYGTAAEEILEEKPDGIFIINGPGNPKEATEVIEAVITAMQ